jgi:hypothetical protein
MKVVKSRNIQLNIRHNLVEVKPEKREAIFDILDESAKPTGKQKTFEVIMY